MEVGQPGDGRLTPVRAAEHTMTARTRATSGGTCSDGTQAGRAARRAYSEQVEAAQGEPSARSTPSPRSSSSPPLPWVERQGRKPQAHPCHRVGLPPGISNHDEQTAALAPSGALQHWTSPQRPRRPAARRPAATNLMAGYTQALLPPRVNDLRTTRRGVRLGQRRGIDDRSSKPSSPGSR